MKIAGIFLLGFSVMLGLHTASVADDKDKDGKEVTLKGKITCAKCELKQADDCTTVIVVKEKGKDVVYNFDAAAHKKYHKDICRKGKTGQVSGTVSTDGDTKTITVKKLKYD